MVNIFRMLSRPFSVKKKSRQRTEVEVNPKDLLFAHRRDPEWAKVLTQSLTENSLAPAEEVILHAFDIYCDELNAPFFARRQLMHERFARITAGFARVQSLAPEMVERAAAKHRLELDRFIDKKGEF